METSSTGRSRSRSGERSHSTINRVKCALLAFASSLKEGSLYAKAFLVGQARKLTARNEKELTRAELEAEKMQVDAADEAEQTKARICN